MGTVWLLLLTTGLSLFPEVQAEPLPLVPAGSEEVTSLGRDGAGTWVSKEWVGSQEF